ncbi:MAG TPA: hypothetical protein VGR26_13380 [Acidimicrobiales bacterium]|nr:hypothetical protein [Acidimicrobiales bacterium]
MPINSGGPRRRLGAGGSVERSVALARDRPEPALSARLFSWRHDAPADKIELV